MKIEIDRADIFPAEVATTANSAGTTFTSAELPVSPDLFTENTPITATAVVTDLGGNETRQQLVFEVAPAADPTAPQATWLTPWQGGEWPALYHSVLARAFTPLLLRAIGLRHQPERPGPARAGQHRQRGLPRSGARRRRRGAPRRRLDPALRVDVGGPASAGLYQLLWPMPNDLPEGATLPFAIRAVDSGGHDSVAVVSLTAAQARRVYEGAQTSIAAGDEMLLPEGDPAGPVFLLDDAMVAIEPRPSPLPIRQLGALYVYGGGKIEANGSTTVLHSRLVASEITTLDSVVKYKPVELEIERALGIGHGSSFDVFGPRPPGRHPRPPDAAARPDRLGGPGRRLARRQRRHLQPRQARRRDLRQPAASLPAGRRRPLQRRTTTAIPPRPTAAAMAAAWPSW